MNNNKILQKCVEELNKENFSREYVLGMLETIIEMNGGIVEPIPLGTSQIIGNNENKDAAEYIRRMGGLKV